MGDIISYIQEKGDLTFEENPFNEVDSLVLSQFAYMSFADCAVCTGDFQTLSDIAKKHYDPQFFRELWQPEKGAMLFLAASKSTRFRDVAAGYFVNIIDADAEKQFSATTFRLSDDLYYIAYRGTDQSFVGWKEDMNLSFMEHTPSQQAAGEYFASCAQKVSGSFMVGGHSKGGNLAMYAAMTAPAYVRERIHTVFDHDGPGFLPQVFQSKEYWTIRDQIQKTIPQTAIVGLLLEYHEDYSVVASDAFAFLQHDPFAWIVQNGQFVHLEKVDGVSKYTNSTLSTWIGNMDMDTRQTFSEALYAIMASTDAATFSELLENWQSNTKAALRQARDTDPRVRRVVIKTIMSLIGTSFSEMGHLVGSQIKRDKKTSELDTPT